MRNKKTHRHAMMHRVVAKFMMAFSTLLVLSGCSKDMNDLQQYVEEVKARKSKAIEPLPEIKPYQQFDYQAAGRRNPFDARVLAQPVAKLEQHSNSKLSPDANRASELLETFPLDTLRMVGTLEQSGTFWALMKTPDKAIQRVKSGNYMGQNYGKIKQISATGVNLLEIIPDGFGGWRERNMYVALSN